MTAAWRIGSTAPRPVEAQRDRFLAQLLADTGVSGLVDQLPRLLALVAPEYLRNALFGHHGAHLERRDGLVHEGHDG
jgi:hypothetical protein